MLVTLVIGTKMRRRPNTSATRPNPRGWETSVRSATTRSRTLPTWSPWGSKIGRPTKRAAYTREGAVLTAPRYRRDCVLCRTAGPFWSYRHGWRGGAVAKHRGSTRRRDGVRRTALGAGVVAT